MHQLTRTKDLSQSLDSIPRDKLKKMLHVGQDRLLELQQEIIDLQKHLKYIESLIHMEQLEKNK
jgi:hypothetical protein